MSALASAPPRRPRLQAERELSKAVRWSIAAHAVIAAIAVKSLVFPGKSVLYIPTLRVDIVGLPDLLKKDLADTPKARPSQEILDALKKAEEAAKNIKPSTVKEKEPPEKADKDEMVLHPKQQPNPASREKKLLSALERIKSLEKLEGVKDKKPKGVLIKGNQISKGTSLSGDAKESMQASYYDQLRDRLQENWALPVWIARQKLSARVQVFIDERGRLRAFKFVQGSGNPQFDDAVKRALGESQPFPIPPQEIADSLLSNGVTVGFPL